MATCCVFGCRNRTKTMDPATLLFTLPLNPKERRLSWLRACQREDLGPSTNAYVCELHFDVIFFKKQFKFFKKN